MLQLKEEIVVWCDGSCRGRGAEAEARYAYAVCRGSRRLAEGAGEVGRGAEMSGNVAEYAAVLHGVQAVRRLGCAGEPVRVRSDSRLVMQQLGMLCVVRSRRLVPWHRAVDRLGRDLQVTYEWVPRSWNRDAHAAASHQP